MTPQMGMAEFFAMEAGEYLERLDGLVSPAGTPNVEEFVRLARALRGSALMANQQPIAAAAAGLEAMARALRESRIPWDVANKQVAVSAVDNLKILIRAVPTWTPREDAKARAVAQELEQVAGVRNSIRTSALSAADAGTRTIAAREGAALASALERAAATLGLNPGAADQVQGVIKVMQPLRGVAGLADLAPLPDILDGIQRAVVEVTRRKDAGPATAAVFRAAAKALTRASREAADGPPATETPELSEFVAELAKLLEPDKSVVSIESLYFADQGPHVVEQGAAQPAPGANARAELVSHGDHLRQIADALDRATSDAQRALRVQSLAGTLGALASAGFGAFVQATTDAVARGAAQRDAAAFAKRLREAGDLLGKDPSGDVAPLVSALDKVAAALRTVATTAAPSPVPAQAAPRVSSPGARAPRTSGAVPQAARVPGDDNAPDLTGSLLRFQRFVEAYGSRPATLDELLAGPPVLPASPAHAAGGDVIPIESLCFTGPSALARALSLRDQVQAALGRSDGGAEVSNLLEEIFDLVRLGQRN